MQHIIGQRNTRIIKEIEALRDCILICDGDVEMLLPPDGHNLIIARGGLTAEDSPWRDKSDGDGVILKDVRKDSPFAVGLRAGDGITAIEEKQTPATEVLRRVLRRKLREGGPFIIFTVRRGKETLDVLIPVKD